MTFTPPVRAFVDPVHGFAGAPLEFDRADCRTLADIIARVPLANEALRPLLRVKLGNAVIVDPSLYHRVLPKIDAWVTVVLPVHGGDNNLLGTIAAVALIGASIFVSAGMATPFLGAAFASGTLGANLLAAGLSLGASLLLQGLNAPKPAQAKAPDDIGSASAQNGFEPGAYLPRVLGRRRIAPPHAMPPYTENDGKDQIVTAVYALAGPHALSDIRIGDSDIAGAADVTYEIREGFATDAPLTLVTKTVIEKQVGVLLSEFKTKTDTSDGNVVDTAAAVFNPYWHKVETQKGPDLARLMFTLPQGIGNTSSSSSYSTWTSMRLRIRKKGAGSWVNLPEFLIKGRQPGQPLRIELDIKWLAAGSMPSSSTGFPSGSGTLGHRGWAQKFNRWPTTGTAKWAADTYFTSTYPHAVSYISGSRIEVSLDTTTFAQDAPYEIEMIRGFPGLTTAINFTNATYDNHDDFYTSRLSSGNQIIPLDPAERPSTIQLTALQSIWDEYPFDLTGQPTTLLAIRARNRNIDSVTCLAEGYAPDWDGSSWVADQKPRNPAAWYREVLRGDLNAEPVPDSLIDMANLVDWHEWCDTAGLEVNAIVEGQPVSEALGLIAQAGLARPRYGVRHGVVIDRPRDMVGLVTLRNAAGFSFEKPFGRMPHALKVQLADETNDFKLREVVVYADGYAAVDGIGGILEATRFESVSYPGITDETQASARALRDLRFGRHRSRLIQFTLDFEHLEFGIGDLVGLQVDILGQMGGQGRVVEVLYDGGNVAGLVLDEDRDFTAADAASADRGALIRLADGTLLSKEVTADDTDLTTVMFATPFAMPTGPGGDLITAGTLVATGTLDHETRPVLIWDLAPGPDLTCRVVAIDYAEDQIYAEPWVPPAPLPDYTDVGAFVDNAAASSVRNFASIELPHGGLVVVLAATRGAADRTIDGMTIDGVTMAPASVLGGGSWNPVAIFTKSVSAGATVDFAMAVGGGTTTSAGIYVLVLRNLESTTPLDTDSTAGTSGTSGARGLDLVEHAIGLWIVNHRTPENTTWTGATEIYDGSPSSTMQWSVALHVGTTTETRNATAAWATSSRWSMAGVSFR